MYPSSVQSFIFNLVAKVNIFIKLIMYVFQLPLAANVSSQSMPSFREKPCATNLALYPMMFHLLLDGTTKFPSRIDSASQTSFFLNWSSLSSWLLLHAWKVQHQLCHCIRFTLHLEMSSLVLQNKSHPSLLVGDYVCDLSYNSNALVVWLEKFHTAY